MTVAASVILCCSTADRRFGHWSFFGMGCSELGMRGRAPACAVRAEGSRAVRAEGGQPWTIS
jgi:hypothetical protein